MSNKCRCGTPPKICEGFCDNDEVAAEVAVTIDGIGNDFCEDCESELNGTHILTYAFAGGCTWRSTGDLCQSKTPVTLQGWVLTGTTGGGAFSLLIELFYATATNCEQEVRYRNVSMPSACTTWSGEVLTFFSQASPCPLPPLEDPRERCVLGTGLTITVSAV